MRIKECTVFSKEHFKDFFKDSPRSKIKACNIYKFKKLKVFQTYTTLIVIVKNISLASFKD